MENICGITGNSSWEEKCGFSLGLFQMSIVYVTKHGLGDIDGNKGDVLICFECRKPE